MAKGYRGFEYEKIVHCLNLRDAFGGDCTLVLSVGPAEIGCGLQSRMASQQGGEPGGWQN
jgi:hypothetical protein